MVDKSNADIGFLGIGSICLGVTSLLLGGLLSVFIGFISVMAGFFGAKKHQVFSVSGMILGGLSLLFLNFVSMGIIQTPSSNATGKEHLANSIYASINAFEILESGELDDDEKEKLMGSFKDCLIEAEMVSIEKIDNQVPGFKFHYRNEFIAGMRFLAEGYENSDMSKKLQGGLLLDKWGKWNNENNQKLDEIKESSLSLVSFVKGMINN